MAWFRARTARAKSTRFTPGLEQLETRAVPAVTVGLTAGVLTVTGTSGNDSIVLKQANGQVSVDGVAGSFASSSINSVVVNGGTGNDSINLSGLKAQPWTKPITVNTSGADDVVKLADGRTVYVGGANQSLATNSSGTTTLNNKALDWFDLDVHDAALRQLLKTDFSDKAISRNEMLAVFKQVEKDNSVTATEFSDLKAVANDTALFGTFTYVADLTHDVVLGNTANAHFHGTTLGNLAAGWTGSKLDTLVGKWFLGTDHPDASYSGITVTYATAHGTLFGTGGPQYTDVHQGAVGDCYFVATLGEIALKSPSTIQNMFIANGDGTYSVKFNQNGVAHWVTVDSQLPTYSGGYFLYANMGGQASSTSNVLWVALAEKAYAQMNEAGWLRPSSWGGGTNSYHGIEGGLFSDVSLQVANRAASSYVVNGTSDATSLGNAVTAGKLIGFASVSNPTDSRVVGNHQYVVIGYNSTTKTVTLFNPWGINNGSNKPGLIDLTLTQLVGNFQYWSVS